MSTQVTFANDTKIETDFPPIGGTTIFQSAYRKTLELRFPASVISFEEIKALYTDSTAMSEITVTEWGKQEQVDPENPEQTIEVDVVVGQSLHLNFSLPIELTLKNEDGVDLWCAKMAQKSAVEIEQERQAVDIANNEAALIELAGIIAGGEE